MEVFYSIIVLIFSTVLIALTFYLQQKKKRLLPPSPPALPILGHLYLLKTAPHLAFQKLFIKYGPLISLRFGVCPILLVSSPSLAEECFTKTNDIIFANRPESIASKYLGYNNTALLVSPYGDHWRNLRRVTTINVFSSISLHHFSSIWTEEIRFMIHKLLPGSSEDKNSWKVIDMNSLFQELVFNVIMKMVAGKRWPSNQPTDSFAPRSVTNICDYIPILRWIGYGGLEKSVISLHEKRDKFAQDLIDETRHKKGGGGSSSTGRRTIIQALLSLQDAEPEYYTDDIVKGIILVSLLLNLFC